MAYTKVIYIDELDDFLKKFRDLVSKDKIPDLENKEELLNFVTLFERQLKESMNTTQIFDVRFAKGGRPFKA